MIRQASVGNQQKRLDRPIRSDMFGLVIGEVQGATFDDGCDCVGNRGRVQRV
jgi:hypothetical protein